MRKWLVITLSMLALTWGSSFAQNQVVVVVEEPSPTVDRYWAGVSGGFPGFNLHFGVHDLISPGIDGRATLSFTYVGAFGLGADVLIALPVEVEGPFNIYGGGGLFGAFGGGGTAFGLNLFVGGEYRLVDANFPQGGLFLELGPALLVAPGFGAGFNGRLGFNYHF
jgi:hypothetical protein